MSIETLQRLTTPNLKELDILIQPGPGGRHEPNLDFNNAEVIAQPSDRISPSVESQKTIFPSSGSISFSADFNRIAALEMTLGITGHQKLVHNPAFERARYERAKTAQDREAVKQGVITNMEKTLYERARTDQSTFIYYQDNEGRVYHPDFPGESFDVVLQRGVENSRRNGHVDYERELKEFESWKHVMKVLFSPEAPVGLMAIVISGPGLKKGTALTDNFVDIFTRAIDPITAKPIIVTRRFSCGATYDEYKEIATRLDRNYFKSKAEKDRGDIDILFKERPIFVDSNDLRADYQLFEEEFKKQKGATEEEKTKHYLDECKLFILHYAETICTKFFDPEKVKIAFNAAINKFDSLRKGILEFGSNSISKISSLVDKATGFFEQTEHYGRMKVEEMMVGCGLSGGFSLGGIGEAVGVFISGVISGISGLFKDKDYCINCGACGAPINRVVRRGQKCPVCPAVRKC